ncbi:hypothetical protein OESDEN_03229 [Oesophagostomum dentatum]|uniref:Uncharacterized protein n=1 Tax=Oesophagostomum dentatum TaxID=61180 RepID=A0A0B1TGY0_OESDE|nr:hypothetical protein OESDEN_03229 [Oesophagostomum dentatum]
MFRRPDDDDYLGTRKVVKAKPLPAKYSEKLPMVGKDFVSSGCEGGSSYTRGSSGASTSAETPITDDERNKIHAKILKAEMKGDKELVAKLKRKLEQRDTTESASERSVVLMKRSRTGNVLPVRDSKNSSGQFADSTINQCTASPFQTSSRIQREYEKTQNLRDMLHEEKSSSADDQLMLFHRSIIVSILPSFDLNRT